MVTIRDEGSALGHAVADSEREADTMQEGGDLCRERCPTDDYLAEVAPEPLGELLADHSVDQLA